MRTFTAYVEWDPETHLYVGMVPGVPGAHTQGATLDELQHNLKEGWCYTGNAAAATLVRL